MLQIALAGVAPAMAQPPEPGTFNIAYLDPTIEAEWKRLREEVGMQEISAAQEAIKRYQQFYEQRGARSLVTAINISRLIAQLYWQKLGNKTKALEIYDWALKTYGDLPLVAKLQKERDLVANTLSVQPLSSAAPLKLSELEEGMAGQGHWAIKAPDINVPHLPSTVSLSPGTKKVPASNLPGGIHLGGQGSEKDPKRSSRISPVVTLPNNGRVESPAISVSGEVGSPTFSRIIPAPASNPFSLSPLSAPEARPSTSPLAAIEAPVIRHFSLADSVAVPTDNITFVSSVATVNPRLTVLSGYIAQWQGGRMSWDQVLKAANLTAADIVQLTSRRNAISLGNSGGALREKLGAFIRQSPELMERWETLPVPAQIALAEDAKHRKDPLGVKIYQHLLSQDVPSDAWWTKELLMYRFSEYYAAQGDYVKAAELNVEIASFARHPDWKSDSYIVAARYYRQANQDEKAQELYERAEVGAGAWALGILRYDRARILISQGKHEEARNLLSLPLEGTLSEQVQIIVWALLGYSYYQTGELELARKYSQDAIDQSQRFTQLLANEGLEEQIDIAQRVLFESQRWSKQFMDSEPGELRVKIAQPMRLKLRLLIKSHRSMPVEAQVDHPRIRISVGRARQREFWSEQEVWIAIEPESLKENLDSMLVFHSTARPGYELRVPLHVQVQEPID